MGVASAPIENEKGDRKKSVLSAGQKRDQYATKNITKLYFGVRV